MISGFVAALYLKMFLKQGHIWTKTELDSPSSSYAQLYVQAATDPFDPPIDSPKKFGESQLPWQFPWVSAGYAHPRTAKTFNDLVIQVFSQEHKADLPQRVTRMLLRLWEENAERLKLTQNPEFEGGIVEVYLCYGGKPGGEQLFDVAERTNSDTHKKFQAKVNTIYIYDLPSFSDPVEMAREVAHEYGHATWYPVGGYQYPEAWANGYLAEKMFLRWMRDDMAKGLLSPDDALGATKEGLDKWIAENVDPLMLKAAQTKPTKQAFADKSEAGMNALIGMSLYIDTLYSDKTYNRVMKLTGTDASDFADNIVLAVEELPEVTLNVPAKYFGHTIWIPVGKGKITGAKIVKFDPSGWVQVEVKNSPIVVTQPIN